MKTVGFIDYFLDEWHAEKYPAWIEAASGGTMKVAYAYGKIDSPKGLSNAAWCDKKGIQLLSSVEEVVEKSDYLIVLSPDNPEFHAELAELPLKSGKRTYIDKTFAPDRETALQLFEAAAKHGTPMYSTSALRFASEYAEVDRSGIDSICSLGPGRLDNYSIHQIEPIISLMGTDVAQVMYTGTNQAPALIIRYTDGRQATINQFGSECPFSMVLGYKDGHAKVIKTESNFFEAFTKNLVRFFESGDSIVDPAETIAIITIIEYGIKASQTPFQWVDLPRV